MTYDAGTNNTEKDANKLMNTVLGDVFRCENNEHVRRLLILQLILIRRLIKMSDRGKTKILNEMNRFSKYSDMELKIEMSNSVRSLNTLFKPNYEVINYMLPEDSSILAEVKNHKENKTESFFMKFEDGEDLNSCLLELIKKLEEAEGEVTNNKYLSSLNKKITIFKQIQQQEKLKSDICNSKF